MAGVDPGSRLGVPVSLGIGALAVWRVSSLVVHEDGPANLVVRVRALVDRTPLAGVMDCFACTSVWVGGVVAVALFGGRLPAREVAVAAVALSGAAMLAERVLDVGRYDFLPEPETDSPLVTVVGLAGKDHATKLATAAHRGDLELNVKIADAST